MGNWRYLVNSITVLPAFWSCPSIVLKESSRAENRTPRAHGAETIISKVEVKQLLNFFEK